MSLERSGNRGRPSDARSDQRQTCQEMSLEEGLELNYERGSSSLCAARCRPVDPTPGLTDARWAQALMYF